MVVHYTAPVLVGMGGVGTCSKEDMKPLFAVFTSSDWTPPGPQVLSDMRTRTSLFFQRRFSFWPLSLLSLGLEREEVERERCRSQEKLSAKMAAGPRMWRVAEGVVWSAAWPPKGLQVGKEHAPACSCAGEMVSVWLWGYWGFVPCLRCCFANSCVQLLPAAWQGMCWSVCVSVSVCPQVRTCICLWPSSGHSARAALGWDRLALHKPRSLKGPWWNAISKAGWEICWNKISPLSSLEFSFNRWGMLGQGIFFFFFF